MRRTWILPLALAAILTLANAAKPVVIDDTAYLFFARHVAQDPSHPYDFQLYWYGEPEPAIGILLPPVLPYWLGAGIALFGERLFLLKLWLFPIAWMLTASLAWLLRKFAKGNHELGLIVLVISPAILVQFNFMLDVPAVAFGLAAVAVFIRSCDRNRWLGAVAAGLLAGLAMQTKYTQLAVPVVFAAYGISQRKWLLPLLAIGVAVLAFASWEAFVHSRCGQSHFLIHFKATANGNGDAPQGILARIEERLPLGPLLTAQLGGVALGFGLWGAFVARVPRWLIAASAAGIFLKLARYTVLASGAVDDPGMFFFYLGSAILIGSVTILAFLVCKWRNRRRMLPWNWNRDTAFLAMWLLIEILGAWGLSPFPAARRVIGVALVVGLIAARGISRFDRLGSFHRTPRWLAMIAVAWGITLFAIDAWDADAEREAVVKARAMIPEQPGGTIWTTGHWGFQYYADVNGMTHLVPHRWDPQPGDWLVFPVLPDKDGFYRPNPGLQAIPEWYKTELIGNVVIDDPIRAQTLPNLYGGSYVIRGREHPRLHLAVYRFAK